MIGPNRTVVDTVGRYGDAVDARDPFTETCDLTNVRQRATCDSPARSVSGLMFASQSNAIDVNTHLSGRGVGQAKTR